MEHTHSRRLIWLFVAGVALFSVLIAIVVRLKGDDIVFQSQILPYHTVWQWLSYRYQTWTGRFFSEGFVYFFSPLPLIFWKITTIVIYAVFSLILFGYYRLFRQNKSKDLVALVIILASPFLMDTGAFLSGAAWVTGSMYYLWIATFALAAVYPLVFSAIKNTLPNKWLCIVAIISTLVAVASEQAGPVICTFALIFSVYSWIVYTKHKTPTTPLYITSFFIISCAMFVFSIQAPGNIARIHAETATWLPNFYTIPIAQHINYAYRWFLDALINHMGYLLIASWIMILGLLIKKVNKDRLDWIATIGLACIVLLNILRGFTPFTHLFNFYAIWQADVPHHGDIPLIIIWTCIILATLVSPLVLYRSKKGVIITVLYLATIADIALVTLSPTMYASGPRTLFIPSVILIVTNLLLFAHFITLFRKRTVIVLGLVGILASANYIYIFASLIVHGR